MNTKNMIVVIFNHRKEDLMEELNPQFSENLEVLGEIQEDEIVHQDPFKDHPQVHQERDEHEEHDEYKECKKT